MDKFTEKQGQYLAYIYYYLKINFRPPSHADFQRYFKISPPSVHRMILEHEKKKLIAKEPKKPRSIRLLISA